MELPAISLPQIDLPFAIPALLHPSVVHFAMVLPVIILLLEIYNFFAKKKSIGGFSFILIILYIVFLAAAYFTGNVDGKETYDTLSAAGQAELKEHKLLGTYLLLGSVVLLVLRLLAMTGMKFFKLLFFVGLGGLLFLTYNQGEEGGELTYEHGANVAKVKALDEALFDAKDSLEDALLEVKEAASKAVAPVVIKVEEVKEVVPPVKVAPVQEAASVTTETNAPAEAKAVQTSEVPNVETPKVEAPKVDEVKVIETAPQALHEEVKSEVAQPVVSKPEVTVPAKSAQAQEVLNKAAQEIKSVGEKALSTINGTPAPQ